MSSRDILLPWIVEAIQANGGSCRRVDVFKYVFDNYEAQLRAAGDLFYTWQYDINWGATKLRKDGKLKSANVSPKGMWELA